MKRKFFYILWSLLSFLTMNVTYAQSTALSGIVLDKATNEPLIGVSIAVKGMKSGTVTDVDGKFSLITSADVTLVVSYIGYETAEIPVNGQKQLTILLSEDTKALDEVVIVGFGTQKKVNLTGAVGIVNAKELADRPVQNLAQALQGLVTGLNITQNNGTLDSKPSINVRGEGTIGDGSKSAPLVLIDGMEGDINAINMQDVDNISILKDAAASSIYGSRAPFGVILVTTKKGVQGKAKFNYNNSFRWNSPMALPHMLDSYRFALYFNDANINGGGGNFFPEETLERILAFQRGELKETIPYPTTPGSTTWADGGDPYKYGNDNVNWYDKIYHSTAFSQEHNVSLSGGSEMINYYVSGNFLGQDGLMKLNQDIFNRYTGSGKVGAKLNDWATFNYSTRWIRQEYERPADLGNGLYQNLARQGWPNLPYLDPNGYLFSSPSPALGLSDRGQDRYQKDWLYQQAQVVLEPVKNWKTFGEFNYRTEDNFRHWDNQVTYNHNSLGEPVAYSKSSAVYEEASRANYTNINIYTEYFKSLEESHNVKVMAGFQSEDYKYRMLSAQKDGIQVSSIPVLDATTGLDENGVAVNPSASGYYNDWASAGFFGRINYDYLGKYLLEANLRYDGSSRFRREHRWDFFPSVSLGWNVARESFWKNNINQLSTFKLRASYGELGNSNVEIDNNLRRYYPTYLSQTLNEGGGRDWLIGGLRPNTTWAPTPVSATLTWESINTLDVGLDIVALNNRLTLTADYYIRKTLNMVGPAPTLPVTYGYDVPKQNNTDLQTTGWEIDLGWKDRIGDFGYNIHILLSDYRTKITKYHNPTGNIWTYYAGKYTGEIWGYETVGIAKTQEEMDAHLAALDANYELFHGVAPATPNQGQDLGSNWKAGDIMYKDLNGDGKITEGAGTLDDHGDLKLIGNNSPRFPFAIDINLDWKGFDLRAYFQGIAKRDYWQGRYYFWGAKGGGQDGPGGEWWSSGFEEHLDYFRPADYAGPLGPNVDSYYPNPYFNTGKNQKTQTRYLQDASYIRLKNIQLGYSLPVALTQKFGCSKLRVFVSGENLWTGTKLAKMFDPETLDGGWESSGSVYPLSKVISAGLSINF
ncbi:MAG: TonB-dependent receptor [Dysgonamonadaceae bacterium]|jgi:TonB-linked SusC/RagA family outer membrane protein|nr:TonB-dependent receptor [Dysgonamonadaceae bacterium]